ncbi:hypothetical protein C0992_006388 [Termitomyces sp. T32_za158]|nr:hypothetical protein C0992_006388 [Termitomyces sp. T32_za158]
MSSTSTVGVSRNSEDVSDSGSSAAHNRLIPSPHHSFSVDHESLESVPSVTTQRLVSPVYSNPSPQQDMQNPFRSVVSSPTAMTYDDIQPWSPDYAGDDAMSANVGANLNNRASMYGNRGVRLTDSGPVPGPEGVRRVSRQARQRPSSQAPPQNRYSRGSQGFVLPPGAAPPQHGGY